MAYRTRFALLIGVLLAFAMPGSRLHGNVRLPSLFSDNMVLQRDIAIPVRGWADPGERVTVSLCGKTASAKTGPDGNWKVTLGAMESGGPFEMTVSGKNAIRITNVLVGEVWVSSGQSNMELPMTLTLDPVESIAAADYPKIRLFAVGKDPALAAPDDVKGGWVACTPETVRDFSAVSYYFGRELLGKLDVPVGLVSSSVGGTVIQAWMSREALESSPDFKGDIDRLNKQIEEYPDLVRDYSAYNEKWKTDIAGYEAKWHEWYREAMKLQEEGKPVPPSPPIPFLPGDRNTPTSLYEGMIRPLQPMAIRGVIWYQGEGNAGDPRYGAMFSTLIRQWREDWGEGEFPFLFVQLANHLPRREQPTESRWAELRGLQLMTFKTVPGTGMAVTIDIGDAMNIHPLNKEDVGKRLALAALSVAHGRDVVHSGPIFSEMRKDGERVRLLFDHVGGGLIAKEGPELQGFAIAGSDGKFVWAEAQIDGDTVVVRSDQVADPVAVRYAWADNPACNLYNAEGLPASPFRTDE